MAKSLFEELGGKYERQGDYLIPCIALPAEKEQPIGTWGQRHLDYLKKYRKVTYINLLTSGRLNLSLFMFVSCDKMIYAFFAIDVWDKENAVE